jgi:hypothetical protein
MCWSWAYRVVVVVSYYIIALVLFGEGRPFHPSVPSSVSSSKFLIPGWKRRRTATNGGRNNFIQMWLSELAREVVGGEELGSLRAMTATGASLFLALNPSSLRLLLASKETNSWGYCVHIQNVWFRPVALPALAPLLFAARVVCWPWLAASELKVAFAFPTGCLATSPILLLLLVHQGQIARSPCKLTKRQTTATTRHCLLFTLAYCIDPANTTLLKTPWPTNFAVGFYCWWELEQQE